MSKTLYFVLVFSLFAFVAEANDGAFSIGPQGGTIYPENNEHIEMLEEEVIYDEATGQFITTFLFRNTSGEAQSVIIGFPVAPSEDSELFYSNNIPSDDELMNEIKNTFKFETWVDEEYISRELWEIGKGNKYKFAFTTTVTFKPNQIRKVVNRFNQGFGYGGSNTGSNFSRIMYILRTGAFWKGNIGKAKIIFKLNTENELKKTGPKYDLYQNHLFSYRKGWKSNKTPVSIDSITNTITWEFKDFEPDFDIHFRLYEEFSNGLPVEFLFDIDTLSKYISRNDIGKFEKKLKKLRSYIKINGYQSKNVFNNIYIAYTDNLLNNTKGIDSITAHYKVRHIINAFAALNNYEFSNPMWAKTFELFDWYTPNTKTPDYSPEIQTLIEKLNTYEKEKQYITEVIIQNETNNKPIEINDSVLQKNDSVSETDVKSGNNKWLIVFFFVLLILPGLIVYLLKKRKP